MTERMTAAELLQAQTAKTGTKRVKNARSTVVDGIRFDSLKEARRWGDLRLLEHAGQITSLRRQVPMPLRGATGPILTPGGRQMIYRADFTYVEDGVQIVEDAKGHETEVFQIKRAILAAQGVKLRIT